MIDIRDFGAAGDGSTNDTQAFRDAVNHCITLSERLYIPAGTYLLDPMNEFDDIPDGTRLVISGDGDSTVLKMRDGGVTALHHRLTLWGPAEGASVWLTFRDFNVDNNARGNPLDPGQGPHQYEQAHTFRFVGSDGVLEKVSFENVHVFDPVADVFSNASSACREFRVVNCGVTGRTRERSDIQFSLIPSITTISDFIGDVIEAEAVGGNSLESHCSYNLANVTVNRCDLGFGGSTGERLSVNMNNLTCRQGFYLTGERTSAKISNSEIRCDQMQNRNTRRLGMELPEALRQSTFTNCKFILPSDGDSFTGFSADESHVKFEGCVFSIEGDHAGNMTGTCLYSNHAVSDSTTESEIPTVTVVDCDFDPRAAMSISAYRAGIWHVARCRLAGHDRCLHVGATAGMVSEVTVDSCDFRKVTGVGFYIVRAVTPRSSLVLVGDHMGEQAARFSKDAGSRDDINVASTRRVILDPGTTTIPQASYNYGLLGDTVVRPKAPEGEPVSWYCTEYDVDGWVCKEQAGIVNVSSLPAATANDAGWQVIYGNALRVWDGAAWA